MNRLDYALKGRDIVVVSQQPWETSLGSNIKDMALELSKYNRILYVNSPVDRITLLRRSFEFIKNGLPKIPCIRRNHLIEVERSLWNLRPSCVVESINWINSPKIFDYLNKRNNAKFSNAIKAALRSLKFSNFLLINDSEMFKAYYLVEYLNPKMSIYYSRDNMLAVEYWKKHGSRLEPELIRKSDICFTNSEFLARYCKNYNSKTFNVGQGCNFDNFLTFNKQRPSDLYHVNGKIIGYVGALNASRLDIDLLSMIAYSFPDDYLVLIGPQDEAFKRCSLHKISNVIFLGQKDLSDVPSYINTFDVCVNPQLINELTMGNYPRKVDEYLLLGKPVVATKTIAMEAFKDVVCLADSVEEFINLIKISLEANHPKDEQKRIDVALSHSWGNSVLHMGNHILQQLNY